MDVATEKSSDFTKLVEFPSAQRSWNMAYRGNSSKSSLRDFPADVWLAEGNVPWEFQYIYIFHEHIPVYIYIPWTHSSIYIFIYIYVLIIIPLFIFPYYRIYLCPLIWYGLRTLLFTHNLLVGIFIQVLRWPEFQDLAWWNEQTTCLSVPQITICSLVMLEYIYICNPMIYTAVFF